MSTLIRERYEVLENLGAGGEARVVKARDRQHDRLVALKIRRAGDGRDREELLGEARILLAVPPHPALPLVREDFFDGDDYVVAMDWVEGIDLGRLVAERGRPGLAPSSVLAYLAQAAEALTHLHTQDPPVIHGDVKPHNLILTTGGRIKLVDFGLSSAPNAPRRRTGTPGFRAPELAGGDAPTRASDVYALAATAFALLTGSPPEGVLPGWEGIDPAQAEQLERAIRLGMSIDPRRRPATPGEFVERLRAGWDDSLPTGVVTFCFSDIEGSTALWEADPVAMAEALVRHDELITDCVEARGGRLIKSMGEGDSTVSVFDAPSPALEAAVAVTRALAEEDWPAGLRIAVRFGLHTGEAERRGADYFGSNVILAARLRGQADGGQIFLSSVTAELVADHLPPDCTLVDLGPHRLRGVGAPEHIRALKGPGVHAPLPVTDCPYRGLLAFEPDDRTFFFGRETVVGDLLERLAPGRLLAVMGASGSGKSSVLRAGLVAAVRAGEVPAVDDAVVLTPGAVPPATVDDGPRRLVVVDQFEELFTLCDDAAERDAFIEALLDHPGPVAIAMRADLYGRISEHPGLARAVADNQILLGAMSDAELQRAVTEPARLAGLRLEPGLVELVLRDVAGEPGALPLLSHALRATWERRDGRTLTVEGYRESGGVGSALARTADAAVEAEPPERRRLVRGVFLRLTELGEGIEDTRRRVAVDDLVPEGANERDVRGLLERLADARLIILSAETAEVAHEVLIREWPTLRAWLDEDRESIRLHRQLGDAARLWDAGGRSASDLYRGARLSAAAELAESGTVELNATERAFVDAGLAEADRERREQLRVNRRLRGLLTGAAVLLVVAIGAGVLSFVQRDRARDAETSAEAQALRSDAERVGALALSAPNLDRSMLLAAAGVRLDDRLETRSALLAALQASPAVLRTLHPTTDEAVAIAVSPDGRLLATGDSAGMLRFTSTRTWRRDGTAVDLGRPVAPDALRFAPDGRSLAVATRQGNRSDVLLVDVADRSARRIYSYPGVVPDTPPRTTALAFSPRGRLAIGVTVHPPTSFTPVTKRLVLLEPQSGRVIWDRPYPAITGQWEARLVFAPDGRLITSAQQGATLVWDARRGRILRRFPVGGPPAVSSDGRRVVIARNSPNPGAPNSVLEIIDLRTGDRRRLASALPTEWVETLHFVVDDTRIVGPAFYGTHVWDAATGQLTETYGTTTAGSALGTAVDHRDTLFTGNADGGVTVWDLEGHRRLNRTFVWTTPDRGCPANPCTVVDREGRLMATSHGDGTVGLIDLRTAELVGELPARDGAFANGLALLPDTVVTGGIAGTVTFWDARTREPRRRLRFDEPVVGVATSRDGRLLAVQTAADGSPDSTVEVRDLETGETLYERPVRFGIGDVTFTPDGRTLVALGCCRPESTVVAWDARTGRERFRRAAPEDATAAEPAPDSRTLAVGTEDGRVELWDLRTGDALGEPFPVAAGNISQIAFTADGRQFAASSFDVSVTVWDVATRKRIGNPFPAAAGAVPAVLFEPDGTLLLTELGRANEWPLDRASLERQACRVAGRELTRAEWADLLPGRPFDPVCKANE